jgi:hypothetical protein
MAFVRNGHRVLWTAATLSSTPPPPPSLLATEGEIMEELLLEFTALFQEPSELLPSRNRTHRIHRRGGLQAAASSSCQAA